MKGIIFNAVEAAVTDVYSADTWDDLLDAAEIDGGFTALGTYDDAQLLALVDAGCAATGHEPDVLVRTLGQRAFPYLARRYPEFVEGVADTRAFLRSVDEIIHPEVMKLHPDATPPRFFYEDLDNGALRMTYQSERRLGVLAEGLIAGAAEWFGEQISIELVSGDGEATTTYDIHIASA